VIKLQTANDAKTPSSALLLLTSLCKLAKDCQQFQGTSSASPLLLLLLPLLLSSKQAGMANNAETLLSMPLPLLLLSCEQVEVIVITQASHGPPTMQWHHHLHCHHCHCCTREQTTAHDVKAPSSNPPLLPLLHEQATDCQQYLGTIICTAAAAVVAQAS
jgi:hypothetical protein